MAGVEAKRAARAAARDRVAAIPKAERVRASAVICGKLADLLPPGPVAAYVALTDEVDLSPVLADLSREGRLVLPRVGDRTLTMHEVADLDALEPGPLGLREPAADAPIVPPDAIAALLVPARAFTPYGDRLGRGGGYYDRLLARVAADAVLIGVGFAAQIVDTLPVEAHDRRVDVVVTDA